MTAIAPRKYTIQTEETTAQAATSESVFTRVGATNNFLAERELDQKDFNLNGLYNIIMINSDCDGKITYPYPFEIVTLGIYNGSINGSSGLTELDVKWKPQNSGAFSSIFTTTPKFTSAAAADSSCFVGQSVAGFTAPVLLKTTFAAYDQLRIDILQTVVGTVDYAGIKIFSRPINDP